MEIGYPGGNYMHDTDDENVKYDIIGIDDVSEDDDAEKKLSKEALLSPGEIHLAIDSLNIHSSKVFENENRAFSAKNISYDADIVTSLYQREDSVSYGSEEENHNPSFLELQKRQVEEDRKWVKYRIDSLTKEQAILFCMIGQIIFGSEYIGGKCETIPTPEDAKQILLVMSYGDHWVLKDLNYILDYHDRVNSFVGTWGTLIDWISTSRDSMEMMLTRHLGISKAPF